MNPPEHATTTGQTQSQQPKKLRFITNHGAPHPKRRRVNAACLTCRKRKIACSGERPTCQTCQQNNQECGGYANESGSVSQSSNGSAQRKVKSEFGHNQQDGELHHSTPHRNDSTAGVSTIAGNTVGSEESHATGTTHTEEASEHTEHALFSGPRNRMPYFRWLGPTAIMPGFKQMVVKVKQHDSGAHSSTDGGDVVSPSLNSGPRNTLHRHSSVFSTTPAPVESDMRTPLALPFYDTSSMPPSELITHLCTTFFTHLGCNFPFLQQERFLKDLEEKQVDAILVDAVCALAARFSTHTLLTQQSADIKATPAEYGQAFAQRGKNALTDTFAMPTVAAVQAALLLAYNEFGESRDSGLWVYLGIAIRMAQDLGLQKVEGLKYEGINGPTPKMVKKGHTRPNSTDMKLPEEPEDESKSRVESEQSSEQRAVERERVDTFWAVFFLDRVVSVGTGRRSTLRDKDIELSFPSLDETDPKTGWPAPFPALIRIVHLYGRVADLLNGIKNPSDITPDTPKRLADMETQVTSFYQGLSSRLHFQAMNFHHYVKAGQGTNFVLLHFWFHTLIILLHQPTLLKTFEGRMLQLFPNSQQLSMSSAKTIADILSYSQLIDTKASLGNPFTTQPIYIAACAFLKETAEQTASSNHQSRACSRATSPTAASSSDSRGTNTPTQGTKSSRSSNSNGQKRQAMAATERNLAAKHSLLATAATQHYQLCYKALESLDVYWSGTRYILTVLDQKFKGVGDPLLYTVEEGRSSLEAPKPEPSFTSPGWRRKISWAPYLPDNNAGTALKTQLLQGRSAMDKTGAAVDPNQGMLLLLGMVQETRHLRSTAIGWTLTGTLNSPSTNLAWHYPTANGGSMPYGMSSPEEFASTRSSLPGPRQQAQSQRPSLDRNSSQTYIAHPTLHQKPSVSHFPAATPTPGNEALSNRRGSYQPSPSNLDHMAFPADSNFTFDSSFQPFSDLSGQSSGQFGDMLIESQDVDMSLLGLDALPWFDLQHDDMLPLFDGSGNGTIPGLDGQHLDPRSPNSGLR